MVCATMFISLYMVVIVARLCRHVVVPGGSVKVTCVQKLAGTVALYCVFHLYQLGADIFRETCCITCFFASEHTVGQGLSENEPFPAVPQHLGRLCKHFTTPVYECSLMLTTRQIEPNLEY